MKKRFLSILMITATFLVAFGGGATASAAQLLRAYNPNTGEHLYTANAAEIPFVVKAGWRNEGKAWEAPDSGENVYRVFNPNNGGDHHYTKNMDEVNNLKRHGWRYEGISWKSGGTTPVYRLYNPNAKSGTHHFTILESEKNHLVKVGWRYEGIAFYSGKSNTIPQTKKQYTTWFTANSSQHSGYNIAKGKDWYATEDEATKAIDKYADGLPFGVSGNWGVFYDPSRE